MIFSARNAVLLAVVIAGLAVMTSTDPAAQEPGSVRGRVSIGIPVTMKRATSTYSRSVPTVTLAPESELRHVVVYVKDAPKTAVQPVRAEIHQRNENFVPRVVAVTVGSTVEFPNDDPIYHNVFSVSGGNRFDLGLYRSGASKSRKFEETGLVRVYCNIHPQMVGFIVVVDSDHVAVTGPTGAFRFDGVPPGRYVLKAWHEETGEISQPVTVPGAGDAPLELKLDATGFKPEPHKNKYGKDYPPNAGASSDERY
jgi:plastocyanin